MAKVNVPAPGGQFAGATTDRGRTPGGRFNGDGISGFVSQVLSDTILWIGTSPPSADQYILWINTEDGRWYGKWFDGDSTQWVDLSLPFGEGLPGPRGPKGERGVTGGVGTGIPTGGTAEQILVKVDGTNYNTYWGARPDDGLNVLAGSGAPDDITDGIDGEFYIDYSVWDVYGPKVAGAWPSGVTMIGPMGDTGDAGVDGNTVLYGVVAPTTEGVDGDFYIDTATNYIYGPKASGSWPAGASLVGPQGATGIGLPTGGTASQILEKASVTDYDVQWATRPDEFTIETTVTASQDVDEDNFLGAHLIPVSSGSDVILTVQSGNPNVGYAMYARRGTGGLTFAAGTSVTINSADSLLSVDKQYQQVALIHYGSDVYDLIGPLV